MALVNAYNREPSGTHLYFKQTHLNLNQCVLIFLGGGGAIRRGQGQFVSVRSERSAPRPALDNGLLQDHRLHGLSGLRPGKSSSEF